MERMSSVDLNEKVDINTIQHTNRYKWARQYAYGNILDIACGIGYGSQILKKDYDKYFGGDIDKKAIAKAKEKYEDVNVNFSNQDIFNLSFENNFFDTVCSFETLEHLKKPKKAIKEVKRVLTKKGVYIGSVPSKFYDDLIANAWQENIYHVTQFTAELLREELEKEFKYVTLFVGEEAVNTIFAKLSVDINNFNVREYSQQQDLWGSIFFIASNNERFSDSNVESSILYGAPYMRDYLENYHELLVNYPKHIKKINNIKKNLEDEVRQLKKVVEKNINKLDDINTENVEIKKQNIKYWKTIKKLTDEKNILVKDLNCIRNKQYGKIYRFYVKIQCAIARIIRISMQIILLPIRFIKRPKYYLKKYKDIAMQYPKISQVYFKIRPPQSVAMVCSTGLVGGAETVFLMHTKFIANHFDNINVFLTLQGGPLVKSLKKYSKKIYIGRACDDEKLAKNKYIYLVQSLPNIKRIKKLNPNVKITLILHDHILWTEKLQNNAELLKFIDHIFCISKLVRDKFHEKLPQYPRAKTSILYNSLLFSNDANCHVDKKDKKTYVWGYAGRFSPEKNVIGIVNTFEKFLKIFPKDKLLVAGDITGDNDALIQYKREILDVINKTPNIEYIGFQDDLGEFYKKIDFFVMASYIEGISVSALDSLAAGVPVVSSNVGSMGDIVKDDKNGMLFPLKECIENPFGQRTDLMFYKEDKYNFLNSLEDCRQKKWNRNKISLDTKNKYSQNAIEKEFMKIVFNLLKNK